MTKQNKIYKMVYMGLLVSMALVLSLIERMLPVPFIAPGAKLGLANLIIVISVYTLDSYKDSFIILILKILLSSILGGSISSLLYSISGGVLSFIVTILVKQLGKRYVSVIGVSTSAAVFHNVGQLFAASIIFKNFNIFLYLPILSRYGIVKERVSALMTDALRANLLEVLGYKTQLLEFIDISHSPKNILIRASKSNISKEKKERALKEVNDLIKEFNFNPTLYNLLKEDNLI